MRYALRAECFKDVTHLYSAIANRIHSITIQPTRVAQEGGRAFTLPDVECVIDTDDLSLDQLRYFISLIKDGHVMLESVNLHRKYTGERFHNGSCGKYPDLILENIGDSQTREIVAKVLRGEISRLANIPKDTTPSVTFAEGFISYDIDGSIIEEKPRNLNIPTLAMNIVTSCGWLK